MLRQAWRPVGGHGIGGISRWPKREARHPAKGGAIRWHGRGSAGTCCLLALAALTQRLPIEECCRNPGTALVSASELARLAASFFT